MHVIVQTICEHFSVFFFFLISKFLWTYFFGFILQPLLSLMLRCQSSFKPSDSFYFFIGMLKILFLYFHFCALEIENKEERPITSSSKVSLVLGFQFLLLTTDYSVHGFVVLFCFDFSISCVRYKANIKYYFWFGYKEIGRGMGALFTILCRENHQLNHPNWVNSIQALIWT